MNKGCWKTWMLVAVIVGAGSSLALGQNQRTDLTAGSMEISLVLPVGLQPFSETQMAQYREEGGAAKFIFSDGQGELLVIVNTFGTGANEKGLGEVADQIQAHPKPGGAVSGDFKRRLIRINGQKWLQLSFREKSANSDLINDCFITDWLGEYVLVEFSSSIGKHDRVKGTIAASARSVQLGFTVIS